MRVIDQGYAIKAMTDPKLIEFGGRLSHKSEDRITEDSWKEFFRKLIGWGHMSVFEHSLLSVHFVTNRGVSHELVRHRHTALTQESTRYCDYSEGKFGSEISFIRPSWISREDIDRVQHLTVFEFDQDHPFNPEYVAIDAWLQACVHDERHYLELRNEGWKAEKARDVLGIALKTEMLVSTNFSEWRWVFEKRAISNAAHPQMRDLMIPLYEEMRARLPEVFDLGDPQPPKEDS
jgi:thymidylate synthase (FAD)